MDVDINRLSVKGAIPCPCCLKEKIIAYRGASGKSSVRCRNCGKFILVDYDKMTAILVKAHKGAYKIPYRHKSE